MFQIYYHTSAVSKIHGEGEAFNHKIKFSRSNTKLIFPLNDSPAQYRAIDLLRMALR